MPVIREGPDDPWAARRRAFRTLHEAGCFVIPNPWDVGSARLLGSLGFPALATTSSGIAWSLGRRDHHVPLYDALARIGAIAAAVDVPVSADFTTVAELAALGVRRISVGGALARAAWTGFLEAAREIEERGTFTAFARAVPGLDIDRSFRTE